MSVTTSNRMRDTVDRALDSDIYHSFKGSTLTMVAAAVTLVIFVAALLAPLITPQDPFDPGQLDLLDAFLPPAWAADGEARFWLGTDNLGRDMYSAILYGSRVSIGVGIAAVLLAMAIGIGLGLISGYVGGTIDAVIMRIADVQISFPAILIVLLIDGVMRGILPHDQHADLALPVVVLAIAVSIWPNFARTVRGSTMVEKSKEYVQAARVIGRNPITIMARHVLPNVMGPVLVIATISLATAILLEAALSFLGVGLPPTEPSLGTLIRIGNDFMFSGEWWIVIFPSVMLATLVLAVNLLGDWLRDALNPKLR
ncbi:MAG: ABC transporter permease [Alphaproteobacteria bacterium]